MAVNRREIFTDVTKRIQQFPGPYVGYVKNSGDINRMGRLFVFIPSLHGEYDEIGKQQENQLIPVSYCSPFAGQTPLSDTTEGQKQFSNTQKSYGFWMVPPDIDTKVLVMFADGDINSGYWMGCVYEDYINHMTPGIGVNQKSQQWTGTPDQVTDLAEEGVTDFVPIAEAQRKAEQNPGNLNKDLDNDIAFPQRPLHTPSAQTLIDQGLITDNVRGTTTSSARRETPSQVFGISTPGPIDFEGQQTAKRESINRHGRIFTDADDQFAFNKVAHSRLGGSTFVMDDGTPIVREGNTNITDIENELIRLRTRSGAQVLLHNSQDVVYIINNSGTAWIEFTQDGKIDIYAKDSISVHTENDMNFRADRDINLEAGRNVNIKAIKAAGAPGQDSGGRVHIDAGANYELVIGTDGLIKAGANIKTFAGTDFNVNTGSEIHFNTSGKVSSSVTASLATHGTSDLTSIMKRIPTQEPWTDHEDKKRDDVNTNKTDREIQ